jgi:hypothetical protein
MSAIMRIAYRTLVLIFMALAFLTEDPAAAAWQSADGIDVEPLRPVFLRRTTQPS